MKDKTTAGIFAILLGGLGIHWFYLGRPVRGIIYLLLFILLFWTTFVPIIIAIICLIEGIMFLCKNQDEFDIQYNNGRSSVYVGQQQYIASQHPQTQVQQPSVTENKKQPKSKAEQLVELKSLLDNGVLTQEEFDSEKQKILNS